MTVNASADFEFTIDKIVQMAYRVAGLLPAEQAATGANWLKRASAGRDFLELIIKSLETEGKLSRAWRFLDVAMVPNQSAYDLADFVMDVLGDAAYIAAGDSPDNASAETVVKQIDPDGWNRLSAKSALGRPVLYFPYRAGATIELRLWPAPTDAGTVRIQAYYLLANSTLGQNTPDLERFWARYLVWALAADLAESNSQARAKITGLQQQRDILLAKAKAYSHQRQPNQIHVAHRAATGSRRWR